MEKKVIILIAFVIILATSLVSAGFWDLITGRVTSGSCTPGLTQNGYCFSLQQGWNLISIPLITPYTAESLLNDINNQGGNCNSIQRWDGSGWQTHPYKAKFNDFSIITGDGYFIYCNSATKWSAIGNLIIEPLQKELTIGWNLVGSRIDLERKAINQAIINCNPSKILVSNIDQEWTIIPNSSLIEIGIGYFVLCDTAGIWDKEVSQIDCIDPDALDYYKKEITKGIVYSPLVYQSKEYNAGDYVELEDYCFSNIILNEYSCFQVNSKSYITQGGISCPGGCKEGVCLTIISNCTDSDGGLNYYSKGETKGKYSTAIDFCRDDLNGEMDYCNGSKNCRVHEYFCDEYNPNTGDYISGIDQLCPNGCRDGACVQLGKCAENWTCAQWSTCYNNQQIRTCTDSNSCGTTTNKPIEIQGCGTALLKSEFLSSDSTANDIINGKISNYDINEFGLSLGVEDGKRDTFAYKFISSLKQVGYTFPVEGKQYDKPQVIMLNRFQKGNNLEETSIITKEAILKLDNLLYDVEIEDKQKANLFPVFDKFIEPPSYVNEPSKEHLAALYTKIFKAIPENIVEWNEENFKYYFNNQRANTFKGSWFNYTIYDELYYNLPYEEINQISTRYLVSEYEFTTVAIHEYSHILDINAWPITINTSMGIINTTSFFDISWDTSSAVKDDWLFLKPKYYDKWTFEFGGFYSPDFVSTYALGWKYLNIADYYSVHEDFAESFTMYILEGRTFRDLASNNPILEQKYNWLKENVFNEIEYDTGNLNYKNIDFSTISGHSDRPNNVVMYSLYEPEFVWDYNIALSKNITSSKSGEAIPCSGCLHNEKCLPIGVRVKSNYCDINGILKSQESENSVCNNNYECATNVCVNDKCISQAVWDRFISWLKRIFR